VDEAHTDPGAIVSLRLQQTLYQIGGNEWFGLLHWQRFLTGPSDPPLTSLGIIYENSISLEAGSILDSRAHPGDFVRIILRWSSPVIIRDSFHVFTHMVGEDETLLAQADFVPLNGLRPMTSWQPGERVVNRFAIEIPADAPPGIYEVRVGIYDPSCGLRLPVTAGCEVGSGYAVLGTLAVQPED
jgi:hypothetical protein